MNIKKLSLVTMTTIALATSAQATLKSEKVTLKGNMQVKFNQLPSSVDTIKEAFSEGMFYGRLRTNTFYWDWDKEIDGKQKDNKAMGIGASLIYKTAPLNGLSGTLGLYTSQNPDFFRMDKDEVGLSKSGKDTFSRHNVSTDGNYGMTVLGQGYLQYDFAKTSFKAGRQIVETVFTKSNDTKMIPNTFDGATIVIKDIPKTTIQLAYLAKQKLRDHTSAHDVLAFDPNNSWDSNDDSAVNKSLTVDKIGNSNELLIASVTNKSIKNLKANVSYAMVPDVISNLVLEAHYTIPVGDWKIVPGVRYMQQFDDLNSNTAVASLKGATKVEGYNDVNSLDSNLLALRMDFKNGAFLGRLGYSKIADEADIVAPWRGFPTGGFTRAMAQYNWYANTKTYMLRLGYDFGKADLIPGFSIMGRYAIQDFDDSKDNVAADSQVIHIDMRQNIGKDLELKLRLGFVTADDDTVKENLGGFKTDTSYNEYRVELNYFF
jgi:hypothetical protein